VNAFFDFMTVTTIG